jgi:hypothetical protein
MGTQLNLRGVDLVAGSAKMVRPPLSVLESIPIDAGASMQKRFRASKHPAEPSPRRRQLCTRVPTWSDCPHQDVARRKMTPAGLASTPEAISLSIGPAATAATVTTRHQKHRHRHLRHRHRHRLWHWRWRWRWRRFHFRAPEGTGGRTTGPRRPSHPDAEDRALEHPAPECPNARSSFQVSRETPAHPLPRPVKPTAVRARSSTRLGRPTAPLPRTTRAHRPEQQESPTRATAATPSGRHRSSSPTAPGRTDPPGPAAQEQSLRVRGGTATARHPRSPGRKTPPSATGRHTSP